MEYLDLYKLYNEKKIIIYKKFHDFRKNIFGCGVFPPTPPVEVPTP